MINEVFRLICDLVNDEAKIVRVQAMKMIVSIDRWKPNRFASLFQGQLCRNGVDISLIHQTLDKKLLRVR